MNTAMHWVILATAVLLAHRAAVSGQGGDEKEQQLITKYAGCCIPEKALPNIFPADANSCFPFDDESKNNDPASIAAEAEKSCTIQCVLGKNGMLNHDLSIKEKEMKELFTKEADASVKPVLKAALDKCFDQHNKNTAKPPCVSGAETLINCISLQILVNCPEKMWNEDKEECKGKRETVKSF